MSATATFASPPANKFDLVEFLKRELKPSPNRWRSTVRLTLACLAATIPIMAFHLRQPVIVMLVMFLLVSEDKTSTLLGSIVAVVGLTAGCGALLLFYVCAVDIPWLRVLCVPLAIATGLFINRVVMLGPLGTAIAVPLAIGMVIPEIAPDPEFLCRFPFYLWWAALLGLTVNYAGHLLLNKNTSQSVLLRSLVLRVEAAENSLRDLAAGKTNPAHASALFHFALEGIVEPLHLMALAAKFEPWLKNHQSELRAKFILVDRLIEAAALMEDQKQARFSDATRKNFLAIADACSRWKTAIVENRPFAFAEGTTFLESNESLPSLLEMERVVRLMPLTFDEKTLPQELKDIAPKKSTGLLAPDAFTNPEYIHFAIKGALAGLICYLFFTSVKYEGIDTAVTTCIVCSLATLGASIQKSTLRIVGATIGGTLGIITLVYFFPHFDSLGGFWFPVAAVSALAAYINFGSPRISYAGLQIGYAFYNCVLQAYGPETELKVVRDRLIGIILGLVVYQIINRSLWPVKALDKAEEKLAVVLQELASLATLPNESDDPAPELAAAYRLRLQIIQDLTTVRQLLESSKFEPDNDRLEYLDEIKNNAQRLFLRLLAVIQHRADLRVQMAPEPVRSASLRFRTTLGHLLLKKAGLTKNEASDPAPDLADALAELEQIINQQAAGQTDHPHQAKIEARLALYHECVPILMNMTELQG